MVALKPRSNILVCLVGTADACLHLPWEVQGGGGQQEGREGWGAGQTKWDARRQLTSHFVCPRRDRRDGGQEVQEGWGAGQTKWDARAARASALSALGGTKEGEGQGR